MVARTENGRIRALVLTTQRTGSTFLVDCLDSHPLIDCASEILIGAPDQPLPEYRGSFKKVMKVARFMRSGAWLPGHRMARFYAGGTAPVRAFKAMYNQLKNPMALRWLLRHEDIRVLHLRRHNLLKNHVSRLLMPKRARVQALAPVDAVAIRVDPAEVISSMRAARALYDRHEQLFARHPRLHIAYEELFDGRFLRADTAARICEFLEIERAPMSSSLVKLNPESLRDMVTNYDELARAIARTEFADLLD